MHTTPTLPEGCTGTLYEVNPGADDEGTDIAHEVACPAHPDATLVCPWCHRPTRARRGVTRALKLGDKIVGELCPSCADESRGYDHEAEAASIGADPPSSW